MEETKNMEETKKELITIISEEGKEEQVEVVVAFKFKDTNQEYIVYTKNEKDSNGNVTVYVSRIVEENGTSRLEGIDDDDEWTRIKAVLRELAKDEQ